MRTISHTVSNSYIGRVDSISGIFLKKCFSSSPETVRCSLARGLPGALSSDRSEGRLHGQVGSAMGVFRWLDRLLGQGHAIGPALSLPALSGFWNRFNLLFVCLLVGDLLLSVRNFRRTCPLMFDLCVVCVM